MSQRYKFQLEAEVAPFSELMIELKSGWNLVEADEMGVDVLPLRSQSASDDGRRYVLSVT